MKANEESTTRTGPSGTPRQLDDVQTVPSYMQRYADEHEAWHAERRASPGRAV
jgi:hypothetical protein